MRYDRTGRAKTECPRSGTKLCSLHAAQTGGWSNGFRLRCRVGALSRQTDASPTIRWCLVMISMVKLMRYDRTGRAKTDNHAPARSFARLKGGGGVTDFGYGVVLEAWSTLSTNGRLPHHEVVSGDDIHGQTHAVKLRSRAQKLRCELQSDRFRESKVTLREARNGHGAR